MNKELKESIEKYRLSLFKEADEESQDEDPSADNGDSQETQDQQPSDKPEKPEGEEPTEQVTPANAQAVQDDAAIDPGTLHVADGTDTGIEINSTNVATGDGEIPPKEGETEIKFEQGNFQAIEQSSQKYSELVQTVEQTFVPLCEKAFIELLGNSASYKRKEFNAVPNMNGNQFKIDVDMIYHVDKYIATDVAENLIKQDQDYIISTIKPTPGLTVRNVKIDCQTGDVGIGVTVVK